MNLLAIAGIAYDIVGAIFIAKAVVLTREKILIAQASTRWDAQPGAVRRTGGSTP